MNINMARQHGLPRAGGQGTVCRATRTSSGDMCPGSCRVTLARMGLSEDPVGSGDPSPSLWERCLWGCPEGLLCLPASPPPYGSDGTHQDQSRCQGFAWKQSWSAQFTCCSVIASFQKGTHSPWVNRQPLSMCRLGSPPPGSGALLARWATPRGTVPRETSVISRSPAPQLANRQPGRPVRAPHLLGTESVPGGLKRAHWSLPNRHASCRLEGGYGAEVHCAGVLRTPRPWRGFE